MRIYVSNLDFSIRDEELTNLFTPFGDVASAIVVNDRETGRSRGFGFVEMEDDNAAQEAIQELDGSSVNGRQLRVSEAKPKPDRPSFGGGGGGRGGNFRSNDGGGYNKRNKW